MDDFVTVGQLNFLNNPDNFKARVSSLTRELEGLGLDFLCLQEVMEETRPVLETALAGIGFVSCGYGGTLPTNHGGLSGNAVFTKYYNTSYDVIDFHELKEKVLPSVVSSTVLDNGTVFNVLSSHLAWGGNVEGVRLEQATIVNRYASETVENNPKTVVVMGGDLNTVEDSSVVRFLTGKAGNNQFEHTFWVDAYTTCGDKEQWGSTNPLGYWGLRTAKDVGIIRPDLVPLRRIDYLMSYGWCYGRPGSPLSFTRFGEQITGDERELSDHFGIVSRFLV